jgi:hypothetical protein
MADDRNNGDSMAICAGRKESSPILGRAAYFLLAILLPLGGCVQKPNDPTLTADLAPAMPNTPMPHTPVPVSPRAPNSVPKHTVSPPEKSERKVAMLDPAKLVGMGPSAIGGILGKPTETQEYAMSTEWTYATKVCSLKIFFYPDIATGALRVLKYIVRNAKGEPGDGPGCVHHLLLARGEEQ